MSTERAELIKRYPALSQLHSDSSWTFFTNPSLAETRKLNALVREGEIEAQATELPSGKPITLYRWAKGSRFKSGDRWLQDDLRAFAAKLANDSARRSTIAKHAWTRRNVAKLVDCAASAPKSMKEDQ